MRLDWIFRWDFRILFLCSACCSLVIRLGGSLAFFDPLPSLPFFCRMGFRAVALKVSVFMAVPALKWKLFIVEFLVMVPRAYRELDGLW